MTGKIFYGFLILALCLATCGAPPGTPSLLTPTTGEDHTLAPATEPATDVATAPPAETATASPTGFGTPTLTAPASAAPRQSQAAPLTWNMPAPPGALARLGKGHLQTFALSPAGSLLAAASSAGVFVYQAENLAEVWSQPTTSPVLEIAFSPDGSALAAVLEEGTVHLWETAGGKPRFTLQNPPAPEGELDLRLIDLAYSPEGGTLATATASGPIQLWDSARGQLLLTLEEAPAGDLVTLVFAPDGRALVFATRAHDGLQIWDPSLGQKIRSVQVGLEGVLEAAFSPGGEVLAVLAASADRSTITLWDTEALVKKGGDPAPLQTLSEQGAWSLAFAPDGETLATGTRSAIRFWEVRSGALQEEWRLTGSPIPLVLAQLLAFSPDGKAVWTLQSNGSEQGPLVRHERASGKADLTLEGFTWPVSGLAFLTGGERLAAGYGQAEGLVILWEAPQTYGPAQPLLHLTLPITEMASGVTALALSPDGTLLAAGTAAGSVSLWSLSDPPPFEPFRLEAGLAAPAYSMAFSPDGKRLAVSYAFLYGEDSVVLWDLASRAPALRLPVSNAFHLAFSPAGSLLAVTGGGEGGVTVWDPDRGDLVLMLSGAPTGSLWLGYTQDGQNLLAAYNNGQVLRWEAPGGKLLEKYNFSPSVSATGASAAALSPAGQLLAAGTEDGRIYLLEATSPAASAGQLIRVLEGHTERITALDFTADGLRLASASADGTVILWNLDQP